jgi:hypothetical protein
MTRSKHELKRTCGEWLKKTDQLVLAKRPINLLHCHSDNSRVCFDNLECSMRHRLLLSILLVTAIPASVLVASEASSSYPPSVEKTLAAAGENRGELEKVLFHYSILSDTLKFKAACFLIGNMEGHSYVTYSLTDTASAVIPFDAPAYPTYEALQTSFDTLEKKHGVLDFRKEEAYQDLNEVTADFLIDHIDYAFKAWREKPWAKKLTFAQFCEYVLPYRGSNEPLENWRQAFWTKYQDIAVRMKDSSDPIEAARIINDDIKTWFTFDRRYYYHPTDQGASEMMLTGMGRCEDMTNVTIFAMRANGLAVTSDYTPAWANAGNNHAWNAIVGPDGAVIPFMGAEANPGEYHLANKLAKVYRKTFGIQPSCLFFQPRKQDSLPGWLAGKSFTDVTSSYVPVSDVAVKLNKPVPDSVDIAYICVFNSGEWTAMHWGKIADGSVTFSAMGRGIVYLPALYLNKKLVPFGAPFILRNDGTLQTLAPDTTAAASLHLATITVAELVVSTDGIAKASVTPGKSYELFYWDKDWKSAGKSTASQAPLAFERVPAGALYWLVADGSDREERIFTVDNDAQIWW